jgi:hypothetical protein
MAAKLRFDGSSRSYFNLVQKKKREDYGRAVARGLRSAGFF